MAELWEPTDEIDGDEDLTVTDHRDEDAPLVSADDEQSIETTTDDPREALEELGEDVSSSPARRAEETDIDPEAAADGGDDREPGEAL
ncbi:hypothetical protein [Leucobacter chromiiresistens]|uniref:Uncharacterized protein n=1 Tax=Leucobacter chromiiresistens TaxID=1079994 RepID=A0A1H0ZBA7_9MICO|nr:hypothetical protein [Leucobacter chromiiresistens]SDQ24727.1 hypothetical protein SAMN04488565_1606 [Leucobacter chromiiresistens]